MFVSKNVLTIEKNQRILPKLLVFPLKKYQERGGQSGKNPTIGGDLYDQGGSKNRGFHNGRNFGGHILTEHPVPRLATASPSNLELNEVLHSKFQTFSTGRPIW